MIKRPRLEHASARAAHKYGSSSSLNLELGLILTAREYYLSFNDMV